MRLAAKVKRGTCSFTQKYAILKSLPCFHSIPERKEVIPIESVVYICIIRRSGYSGKLYLQVA